MTPGDSCNNLLHKRLVGPRLCECSHVLHVSRRESLHLGERAAGRRSAGRSRVCPSPPRTAEADAAADLPIQQDEFPVDADRGAQARVADPRFQRRQQVGIGLRCR